MRARWLGCVALIAIAFSSFGCVKMDTDVSIAKDGSVTNSQEVTAIDTMKQLPYDWRKDVEDGIKTAKETAKKEGETVTEVDNGFKTQKVYPSIQAMIEQNTVTTYLNPDEKSEGVRYRKGFLFDMYSVNSTLITDRERQVFQKKIAGIKPSNNDNFFEQQVKITASTLMDSATYNLTLHLPYAADSSNADTISDGRQTLSWDLKNSMLLGKNQKNSIQAKFRIYHESAIYALAAAALILLLVGFGCFIYGLLKKDDASLRKAVFSVAGVMVLALIGECGFVYHLVKNPPELTNADRIVSSQAVDSEGRNLAATIKRMEDTPINDTAEIAEILKKHGYTDQVTAVSKKNDEGAVARLADKSKNLVYYVIYDAASDSVAKVTASHKDVKDIVYSFREAYTKRKDGTLDYSQFIFEIERADDGYSSPDGRQGVWLQNRHVIPLYILFHVDEADNVIVDKYYTGGGRYPSHYHSDLKDERNKRLARIFVTQADSLKTDIIKRGIYKNS